MIISINSGRKDKAYRSYCVCYSCIFFVETTDVVIVSIIMMSVVIEPLTFYRFTS